MTAPSPNPRAFQQVDVFTATAYYGNPVAVVLQGEGLSDEAMQHFARWTNLSETTFVLPPTDAGRRGVRAGAVLGRPGGLDLRRPADQSGRDPDRRGTREPGRRAADERRPFAGARIGSSALWPANDASGDRRNHETSCSSSCA